MVAPSQTGPLLDGSKFPGGEAGIPRQSSAGSSSSAGSQRKLPLLPFGTGYPDDREREQRLDFESAGLIVMVVSVGQPLANTAVAIAPGGHLALGANAPRYQAGNPRTGAVVVQRSSVPRVSPASRDEIALLRRLQESSGIDLVPLLAAVAKEADTAQCVIRSIEPLAAAATDEAGRDGVDASRVSR